MTYSGLPKIMLDALLLVINHAEYLPHLHCEQARQFDTALLMVGLSQIQGLPLGSGPKRRVWIFFLL